MTRNIALPIFCAAALVGCYAPVLAGLVRQWSGDPDMSHGFLVLPVAGWIAWRRRAELRAIQPAPNWWGFGMAACGAAQMLLGTLAAQVLVARAAFLVSVTGAILFLGGARALRILAFPLGMLLFLFPLPAMLYARITLPLQILSSWSAESILSGIGIPVLREGNILELPHARLSVVEACSGIRSLLSMGFLALVYGYFFDRRASVRGVLLAATVPIAIAANAVRVALMGILGGGFHLLEGWAMFAAAFAMLVGIHRCSRRALRQGWFAPR